MLILVCGLPGSGKTRVAKEISRQLNIPILSTDYIRKKLLKKPTYIRQEKELIYKVLFLIAEEFLKQKLSIILDANFPWGFLRLRAKKMARLYNTCLKIIEVRAKERILLKRIEMRQKQSSLSKADKKIYFKIKKEFQPIKLSSLFAHRPAVPIQHLVIDNNSQSFKITRQKLKEFLKISSPKN